MRALVRSTSMRSAQAVAATLIVVSLAVAGCTSSDETPSSTSSVSSSTSGQSASGSPSADTSSESATGSTDAATSDSATSAGDSSTAATSSASAVATTSSAADVPQTSDVAPPPTTEVPPPTPGNIDQTVAPSSLTTAASVPLTASAQFGGGVTAGLTSIVRQDITAQGPGEISGPGLVLTIKITNSSSSSINLDAVNVTLEDGNATPGSPMSGSPYSPFTGDLAAGADASAVYVFALPTDYKNPSTISVSYSTTADVIVFTGDAP